MRCRDGGWPLALYVVAVVVRLLPLVLSPLPYNVDGFAQVHVARVIGAAGAWTPDLDGANPYDGKLPILPVLLTMASGLLGVDPMTLAPVLVPFLGAVAAPGVYALARALGLSRKAATVAGLFVTLSGTFAFLTGSVMKEALGLGLLPLFLRSFVGRRDPRRAGLAMVALGTLTLLHNLTAAMAVLMAGAMALAEHVGPRPGRAGVPSVFRDIVLLVAMACMPLAYYPLVHMEYVDAFPVGENGVLMASVAVVLVLALLRLNRCPGTRGHRPASRMPLGGGVAVLVGGLLVLVNGRRNLFVGTSTTAPLLLLVTAAYVPLALLALRGIDATRRSRPRLRANLVALAVVPLGPMVFALLRGLDLLSFTLLYRSFDFLDVALALGLGAAVALRPSKRASIRRLVHVAIVACLVLSLPAFVDTPGTFGVRNATAPAELAALDHAAQTCVGPISTDQRFATIMASYEGRRAGYGLPLELVGGRAPLGCWILADDWSRGGAQVYPLPTVTVPPSTLEGTLDRGNVVYVNSYGVVVVVNNVENHG